MINTLLLKSLHFSVWFTIRSVVLKHTSPLSHSSFMLDDHIEVNPHPEKFLPIQREKATS